MNKQLYASGAALKAHMPSVHLKVQDWGLTTVKSYMIAKGVYPAHQVDAVEVEYKRFLTLCFAFPQLAFAISAEVDKFWHVHILFTQDYHAMCLEIGGGFLHHRPDILDTDELLEKCFYRNTLPAYQDNFGPITPDLSRSVICICRPDGPSTDPNMEYEMLMAT